MKELVVVPISSLGGATNWCSQQDYAIEANLFEYSSVQHTQIGCQSSDSTDNKERVSEGQKGSRLTVLR